MSDDEAFRTQRVVHRSRATLYAPVAGLVIAGLMLVYDIVRRNQSMARQAFWPELLSEAGALTAIIGALSVLFARWQFVLLKTPDLRYDSRWVAASTRLPGGPAGEGDQRFWQVVLSNVGEGVLRIQSVRWRLRAADGPEVEAGNIDALREMLRGSGLVEGRDYWMVNFSRGHAMRAGKERVYFEIGELAAAPLVTFGATFSFTSLMRDVFERDVELLPGRGASKSVLTEPSPTTGTYPGGTGVPT